jgi:hypothetical protein
MTPEQLLNAKFEFGEPPVRLRDGKLGLLIGYPYKDSTECRIQVRGEEDSRKIDVGKLSLFDLGLIEEGAKDIPMTMMDLLFT